MLPLGSPLEIRQDEPLQTAQDEIRSGRPAEQLAACVVLGHEVIDFLSQRLGEPGRDG